MNDQQQDAITLAAVQLVELFPDEATEYANAGDQLIAGGWHATPYALVWPHARIVLRGLFAGQCDCAASRGGQTCEHARQLDVLVWAGLLLCGAETIKRRQDEPVEAARLAA